MQQASDNEQHILFNVIDGRYQNALPTIIISNLTVEGVASYLGARSMDWLPEGGGRELQFLWESYRRQKHVQLKGAA